MANVKMEEIQHALDTLIHDMRSTNVRSNGLKTVVHEQWIARMDSIIKMVKQRIENTKKTTVPPAPPGE